MRRLLPLALAGVSLLEAQRTRAEKALRQSLSLAEEIAGRRESTR